MLSCLYISLFLSDSHIGAVSSALQLINIYLDTRNSLSCLLSFSMDFEVNIPTTFTLPTRLLSWMPTTRMTQRSCSKGTLLQKSTAQSLPNDHFSLYATQFSTCIQATCAILPFAVSGKLTSSLLGKLSMSSSDLFSPLDAGARPPRFMRMKNTRLSESRCNLNLWIGPLSGGWNYRTCLSSVWSRPYSTFLRCFSFTNWGILCRWLSGGRKRHFQCSRWFRQDFLHYNKPTLLNPFKHVHNGILKQDFHFIIDPFIEDKSHNNFNKKDLIKISVPLNEIVLEEYTCHFSGGFLIREKVP